MCGMDISKGVIDIGDEELLWQGRPAPRCYTFRHWRRALMWTFICVLTGAWQVLTWLTMSADSVWSVVFLPTPLLLIALSLSLGGLVRARLEWEHIFYIMSDTCVRIQRGRGKRVSRYLHAGLKDVRLEFYHNNASTGLGWVHFQFGNQKVTLECLEDAQKAYTILLQQLAATKERKHE